MNVVINFDHFTCNKNVGERESSFLGKRQTNKTIKILIKLSFSESQVLFF